MKKTATRARTKAPATTAKAAAVDIDPAFEPVVAAFATDRQVGLGRMFSSKSVLNVNGKIFAMFVKGRFVAKLPKERVAAMVSTGAGAYFDPGHGRLMKEWVAVADARAPWVALAREAHAFVKAGSRRVGANRVATPRRPRR